VSATAASEAAALAALYAAAWPNETLTETVARLRRPRFAEALAVASLSAWRDLQGDPMNDHPDLTIDARERGRPTPAAPRAAMPDHDRHAFQESVVAFLGWACFCRVCGLRASHPIHARDHEAAP
jgi:hypothetical protein